MSAVDYVLELDDAPDAELDDERFANVLAAAPVALTWQEILRMARDADEAAAEAMDGAPWPVLLGAAVLD